ncbi:MAG TPA: glutamate racemase [Candidatus Paceibacterota bacterium]|nr:glutamate racemase [Candidatus Paceibacterota bacterium]HRZ34673.1 glutamate racemase [Candidatus Paceibacterota bacterium]
MKIGVFDSGFGGLDIFRQIEKILPKYDFVYLGDNARAPYGSRSQETIYQYVTESLDFLFSRGCQLVILACNTASAEALRKVQQAYLPKKYPTRRVLGVIIPAIEEAVQKTKNRKIGILGTESTIQSEAFVAELKKKDSRIRAFQKACPLLVPIVEAGEKDQRIVNLSIENYLKPLVAKNVDTLILGCTHYGLLLNNIRKILAKSNRKILIVSEGKIVAKKLADYLRRHPEIERLLAKNSKRDFYTTDLTEKFRRIGGRLMGRKIGVQKVSLN